MTIIECINEIVEVKPIRIVVSNPVSKENEILKIKFNQKILVQPRLPIENSSDTAGGLLVSSDESELKSEMISYQIERFTKKQVFHENIEISQLGIKLMEIMKSYKQLSAESDQYSIDMRISKKGKVFFSKKNQKNQVKSATSHNKKKNYILEEGMDIPAMVDLGIFTKDGKIINSRYDKYKQINRFVELIDHEIKNISKDYSHESDNYLHILDFGCGKSYLTFILYYYFTEIKKMNVKITGLDLKKDVIEYCNEVAEKYGYENLRFELGDINGYKYENKVDMVITLHACDTATDYALYNAIKWNTKMIFSVPCCQHEVNASIKPETLDIISKYGIVQERMSALFTDLVRANILEGLGYKTQLLEFIDIAHSPKNLLIRAVKSNISEDKKKKAMSEVERLREEFKFEQTLYNLCKLEGLI